MVEHIEGEEISHYVEAFSVAMLSFADQAEAAGVRAIEITAHDAAVALMQVLDVLTGPACETLAILSFRNAQAQRQVMVDHIEGKDISRYVEAFSVAMMSLADQAEAAGMRAAEITARDAAVALMQLLDVLEGPARDVLANP